MLLVIVLCFVLIVMLHIVDRECMVLMGMVVSLFVLIVVMCVVCCCVAFYFVCSHGLL